MYPIQLGPWNSGRRLSTESCLTSWILTLVHSPWAMPIMPNLRVVRSSLNFLYFDNIMPHSPPVLSSPSRFLAHQMDPTSSRANENEESLRSAQVLQDVANNLAQSIFSGRKRQAIFFRCVLCSEGLGYASDLGLNSTQLSTVLSQSMVQPTRPPQHLLIMDMGGFFKGRRLLLLP